MLRIMTSRSLYVTLTVALLMSLAHGDVTHCSPSHTQPKLRFVAQLRINGCPVFVHDTGAKDGPHLAVEPIMCVTQSLDKVFPRYDPITEQTYVSVPVMLRDDAMLTEVEHQLRHLSPKSVKFATIFNLSVPTESLLRVQIQNIVWSPDESVGFLRLGCPQQMKMCNTMVIASNIRTENFVDLEGLQLVANISADGACSQHLYSVHMQNQSFTNPEFHYARYKLPSLCKQLRYIKSINLNNCTVRVHQRLDMKGHFLIESLLCHNLTSITNKSIMYDYSRDMYYLKLDLVLQDDTILDAVRSKLTHLSPLNVTFMRLWRAERVVASALSKRFKVGQLMVSGDWRSGQVRVYCERENACKDLRSWIIVGPLNFWRHIKWSVTASLPDRCVYKTQGEKYSYRMQEGFASQLPEFWGLLMKLGCTYLRPADCKFINLRYDRFYAVLQQRLTGSVSFQQGWFEYETGFGDGTDFWIGLSTIHWLSINGATLRVEMKLWNGTELHAEYAAFKVGDASTNYRMTYREMIRDRSSVSWDALEHNKGAQFSTIDRDNDNDSGSCSNAYGKGGWWFNNCHHVNPNGIYGNGSSGSGMVWYFSAQLPLREARLMLQI